jgi:hypothetical protein
LAYRLNDFIPTGVVTDAGDGGVTGNKSPDAGLNLTWGTDTNWSTWYGNGQDTSKLVWTVIAGDSLTSGVNGFARSLVASSIAISPTNQVTRNSTGTAAGASAIATLQPNLASWTLLQPCIT